VDDFADRVRAAQRAKSAADAEQQARHERELDEERAAQEQITRAATAMAQALTAKGVPIDVRVIWAEHLRRKKLFGGWEHDVRYIPTLEGWRFAGRTHTFRDPESRSGRVETSYNGYVLATDGRVHTCSIQDVGADEGVMEITHRDPWGSEKYQNGPLATGVMRTYLVEVLDGLIQLAVAHHVDPERLGS